MLLDTAVLKPNELYRVSASGRLPPSGAETIQPRRHSKKHSGAEPEPALAGCAPGKAMPRAGNYARRKQCQLGKAEAGVTCRGAVAAPLAEAGDQPHQHDQPDQGHRRSRRNDLRL